MFSEGLKYYRGSKDSYEAVEADITRRDGTYITTCVINVDLLLCGLTAFPCGNGEDYPLTPEQQLKVLEFIRRERKALTDKETVKTLDGWHKSGLPTFEDYCFPGDTVAEDIVDYFVNSVPPVLIRSACTQAGEAYSMEPDGDGKCRNTYTTFHREPGGNWIFDGYCFHGSNENRVSHPSRLERRITEIRRKVKNG